MPASRSARLLFHHKRNSSKKGTADDGSSLDRRLGRDRRERGRSEAPADFELDTVLGLRGRIDLALRAARLAWGGLGVAGYAYRRRRFPHLLPAGWYGRRRREADGGVWRCAWNQAVAGSSGLDGRYWWADGRVCD